MIINDVGRAPLLRLDALWFQVAGTLCNLECMHCFISCSPTNHSFGMLDLQTVERALEDARARGVREFYFTGGEPFLNREIIPILAAALALGPTTVLTNGLMLRDATVGELRTIADRSPYSFEIRVSVDGPSPATNDPLRGAGTFARAMKGIGTLARHGFLPILTCTRTWPLSEDDDVLAQFRTALAAVGCSRPRLKVLPALKIGAEAQRTAGYAPGEVVTRAMLDGFEMESLVCTTSRIVTDRGVWVCPILIDSPQARLGDSLADADRPFALAHGACTTCWAHGAICSNQPLGRGEG